MGVDLHWCVETLTDTGWSRAEGFHAGQVPWAPDRLSWLQDSRSPLVFAILGHARASVDHSQAQLQPVAPLRGFPSDASAATREEFDGSGGWDPSWVTVKELLTYDWLMPVTVTMTFFLPAASQEQLRQADEWLDSRLQEAVYDERVPNGEFPESRDERGQIVVHLRDADVTLPLGTWIPDFMTTLVWMASVSGGSLHTVRAVYWFF